MHLVIPPVAFVLSPFMIVKYPISISHVILLLPFIVSFCEFLLYQSLVLIASLFKVRMSIFIIQIALALTLNRALNKLKQFGIRK